MDVNLKNNLDKPISPLPKTFDCFQCKAKVEVKWCRKTSSYSRKHCWNYWIDSDLEEDKEKHICGDCIRKIYYNKEIYWNTVKDKKKRTLLTVYISEGKI